MNDELQDLMDANDAVIGTINRSDYDRMVAENLGYIRVASLFIVNSQGQIYTPIRTAHKTIAPNGFDFSAAGHVESGSDYLTTIVRETKEELNIDVQPGELEFIAKTLSEEKRFFESLFMMRSNETPSFNPNDFVSASWLYPEEILTKIKAGHPTKDTLASAITLLIGYLADKK